MWKIFVSLIIFSFLNLSLKSQVANIDREISNDSAFKKNEFSGVFAISSDKQKNNIIDLSTNFEFDKNFKNKYVFITNFRNDAVFFGNSNVQNEGLIHFRYRDRDTRKISTEEFVQYQWNGAWGLESRYLTGINLRVKITDKKDFDFYYGSGLFYEWEKWNWSGVKDEDLITINQANKTREMLRLNQYLKFAGKLSKTLDLAAVSFLQFPMKGQFFSPRWYFETNAYLLIGKHFNLVLHWDHTLDQNTLVPIDDFYYGFSTGLQINF